MSKDTPNVTLDEIKAAADKKAEVEAKKAPAKVDPALKPYQAADKEEVEALWAKFGRDRVKGLAGFRKMTLGQIANALK